ncbi:MAG: alpha-L-fucosidase [Kiritimatiellaeota bacterium]|nr:alpha-L-fucosidase [Kiritimatiellota bacterium]
MAEPATERTDVLARYEEMRYGMFLHFDINTFREKPKCLMSSFTKGPLPPPEIYCPTDLDVDQWISAAKEAGMRYAVLTVKHWLGFALWDSKYSDYDVAASGNRTDVVAKFVDACRKHSVAPCFLYTLTQDMAHRRDKGMGEDEWFAHAFGQVTELLTDYGPVTAMWYDGLGGGDFPPDLIPRAYALVKSLQPNCLVVVHDPGRRGWWPTDIFQPGRNAPPPEGHNPWMTHNGKTYYVPADVIDTVVESWFWNPEDRPRPLEDLLENYRRVTGRGANLTLGLAPDREGKLPADQVERLMELARVIDGLHL